MLRAALSNWRGEQCRPVAIFARANSSEKEFAFTPAWCFISPV
jgi:hypothetical protein